jgi:hypothetical protein
MPRNNASPQEQQMQMQNYNPFGPKQNTSWDAICMDRMLSIKRPAVEPGIIWITDKDFAETLSLLPLNKSEQRKFWKKFRLIQMIAPGELSRKIVVSRQERLAMELISQKSRLDAVEGGNINERGWWGTSVQKVDQTLRTPSPTRPKGFVESLLSGGR